MATTVYSMAVNMANEGYPNPSGTPFDWNGFWKDSVTTSGLQITSPGDENGWIVKVPSSQVNTVLARVGAAPAVTDGTVGTVAVMPGEAEFLRGQGDLYLDEDA